MAKTSIKIGKKDYPFRLDFKAIRIAEKTGDFGVIDTDQWSKTTYFITVLWAGINREDSTVTYIALEKAVNKAIEKREITFAKIQEFVLTQLKESGALSGYEDEKEDEPESPLALASKSTND